MKLMCNVEVSNRLDAGTTARKKAVKSCLSIGKVPSENDELYIILQTLQNKSGTKYKVKDNIEIVFTKFIEVGKMTIRFKEPPHDLFVQCDAIQLKSFARVMKLGFTNKLTASVLSLSDLKPKAIANAMRTKVNIKNPEKYPILEGFPRTTIELYLTGLGRRSFDRNILKLQNLRILDLSDNQITILPKDLGSLPNLQELNLAQNLIGKSPQSKWVWMDGVHISKNLKLLDLSSNEMAEMPDKFGKLSSLVTLKVNTNSLQYLPQTLGRLEALKFLDVSKNKLVVLPGSIRNLRLNDLNIAHNSFFTSNDFRVMNLRISSLVESAAQAVLKSRIHYDASNIPFTLVIYLEKAQYCFCGNACFDNYIRSPLLLAPNRCAASVISSGYSSIPFDCFFCSMQCFRRYSG